MSDTPVTDQLERIALCRAMDWPNALREMERQNADLTAELAAVKAERDAALKDAERYRWLTRKCEGGRRRIINHVLPPELMFGHQTLESAIDAAREG